MAYLYKSGNVYALQWSNSKRTPSRIHESLGTSNKAEALKIKSKLEYLYNEGDYDPFKAKFLEIKKSGLPDLSAIPRNEITIYELARMYVEEKKADSSSAGWTKETFRGYKYTLEYFINELGADRRYSTIDAAEISKLIKKKKVSTTTRNNYVRRLSAFFNWIEERGFGKAIHLKREKADRKLPKYVTTEELLRICDYKEGQVKETLAYCKSIDFSSLWYVDAWKFAARTGLRISELLSIKVSHIAERTLYIGSDFRTKSSAERAVPLMDFAEDIARRYCDPKVRENNPRLKDSDLLFGRKSETTKARLSKSFRECSIAAIGKRRTFHDLRHSFAYWYLTSESEKNREYRLVALKELLGHSSIDTTLIYSKLAVEDLRL